MRAERLEKRLARMPKSNDKAKQVEEIPPVEEIELTEEQRADPSIKSVRETLMPGGAVLVHRGPPRVPGCGGPG